MFFPLCGLGNEVFALTSYFPMSTKNGVAIPFVHPAYVRCVLDCLNSRGVSTLEVLASAGLSWQQLGEGQPLVDFSVFRRFVTHAIRCSGEPALGLVAGSMLQPYHSPLGIATVTSDNLGQALQVVARHGRLFCPSLDFQLENDARWSILRVSPLRPLCETHVFVMQSLLAVHCRMLETILGRPVDELSAGMPYPRPPGNDVPCMRYVRRVEFDQTCLMLRLPARLLDVSSVSADPGAHQVAARECRRMGAELGHVEFIRRVRQALLERLPTNPELSDLAPDLGVSTRTLVRRLAEADLTFLDIKDDLRKTHAAWYLQHTELTMEAIATQLGYGNPTNFSRKFKDWYRVPPTRMRQSLRAGVC